MQDPNIFGYKIFRESIFFGLNFTLHPHPVYKYSKHPPGGYGLLIWWTNRKLVECPTQLLLSSLLGWKSIETGNDVTQKLQTDICPYFCDNHSMFNLWTYLYGCVTAQELGLLRSHLNKSFHSIEYNFYPVSMKDPSQLSYVSSYFAYQRPYLSGLTFVKISSSTISIEKRALVHSIGGGGSLFPKSSFSVSAYATLKIQVIEMSRIQFYTEIKRNMQIS